MSEMQPLLPDPVVSHPLLARRSTGFSHSDRMLATELPVAFSYNGTGHAVMMATPDALEDFAVGFSLAEGIISSASEIVDIETVIVPDGIELRIWVASELDERLAARRRRMTGPLGCGICGLETLAQAVRALPPVPLGRPFHTSWVAPAIEAMAAAQSLNRLTHSLHAAGFWRPEGGLLALREDVGRHNALDKLCGALARTAFDPADGAVVLTSRVSVEMVQKTAVLGCPTLVAVSAPTLLAVKAAGDCGMTLIASVRGEQFEVFSGSGGLRFQTELMAKPATIPSSAPCYRPNQAPYAGIL